MRNRTRFLVVAVALCLALSAFASLAQDAVNADGLLVWHVVGGSDPAAFGASSTGAVSLFNPDNTLTPLMEIPPGTPTVVPCGENAQGGGLFFLYVGGDVGALYRIQGRNAPEKVLDVPRLSCVGGDTFQVTASGNRFAFLDYAEVSTQGGYANGNLRIYDAAGAEPIYREESVTAFQLREDGATFLQLFIDDRGTADEAALINWNGQAAREFATFRISDDACGFTSGVIRALADGRILTIIGESCRGAGTTWTMYLVTPGQAAVTVTREAIPGSYQPFARSNIVWLAPDGTPIFSVPDGVTANTAGIVAVRLAEGATANLITLVGRQAVLPALTPQANALPRISLDGRYFAVVETSTSNDNVLRVFDLNNIENPPFSLPAGSRGDTISALNFHPNNQTLYAIYGGDRSASNTIGEINLASGGALNLVRGRFSNRVVVSQDGARLAAADWIISDDSRDQPTLDLVLVDTVQAIVTTILDGGTVNAEGRIDDATRQFAQPLAWLP